MTVTHRERQELLDVAGGLLGHATLCRNSAAILTEHTLLPLGGEMAAALRVWAGQLEDWSAELSELVIGTRMER
jgi:hypothetical protein